MAGVLRRVATARPEPAGQAAGPAAGLDLVAGMVDLFVLHTVETLCRVEAGVPPRRQPPAMRARIAAIRARLEALEDLLADARRAGPCC